MSGLRTERLIRMLGHDGVAKLASSHVLLIGLGGVGSSCGIALARGGVGSIRIVDFDSVDITNINRQALAFESTIGKKKTDVMRDIILDINPEAQVESVDMRVLPENVEDIFPASPLDYCIDAQDTIATKLALAQYCENNGIPFISSMGAANKVDPTLLRYADIYDTEVCPLSRVVRKRARKQGVRHMEVLYTPEQPAETEISPDQVDDWRAGLGTMSYMPPIMGQMLAARVICNLLEIELQQ